MRPQPAVLGGRQPYAYFASYKTEGNGGATTKRQQRLRVDWACAYIQQSGPPVAYANASSFQIISAGRDGKFGAGAANWNPASGTSDPNGKDDQSNFSPHLLGASAN